MLQKHLRYVEKGTSTLKGPVLQCIAPPFLPLFRLLVLTFVLIILLIIIKHNRLGSLSPSPNLIMRIYPALDGSSYNAPPCKPISNPYTDKHYSDLGHRERYYHDAKKRKKGKKHKAIIERSCEDLLPASATYPFVSVLPPKHPLTHCVCEGRGVKLFCSPPPSGGGEITNFLNFRYETKVKKKVIFTCRALLRSCIFINRRWNHLGT